MNTYPTQVIPTDKHGNVYYGPRTYAEAEVQIDDGRPAKEMAEMMRDAGYRGIANRICKRHEVSI